MATPRGGWHAFRVVAVMALLAAGSGEAWGFGGAWVGEEGATLDNAFSHVVYVRTGQHSTLTVAPDFEGDVSQFGLIVPVPTAPAAEDVLAVDPEYLSRLDAYSAPRLLEYTCDDLYPWWDEDYYDYYYYDYYDWYDYYDERERRLFGNNWGRGPWDCTGDGCGNRNDREPYYGGYGRYDDYWDTASQDSGGGGGDVVGVAVEASFLTGGYEVVVLSAEESSALAEWLAQQGWAFSDEAQAIAQSYVDQGWYFVVARVDLGSVPTDGGLLPPLRIGFESEAMTIPLRLGTVNSTGVQRVVLHTITDNNDGRVTVPNYRLVTVDDDCMWQPEDSSQTFTEYYEQHASDDLDVGAIDGEYAAWAHEFQWEGGACDPCTSEGALESEVMQAFGWDAQADAAYVTRIRLEFTPGGIDQDPVLTTGGLQLSHQLEFVQYDEMLESDFPICDSGWDPNPATCFDRSRQPRSRSLVPREGAAALPALLLFALTLRRRRAKASSPK